LLQLLHNLLVVSTISAPRTIDRSQDIYNLSLGNIQRFSLYQLKHGVPRSSCCLLALFSSKPKHVDPSKNWSVLYSDIANTVYGPILISPLIICSSTKGALDVRLLPVTPDIPRRINISKEYTPGGMFAHGGQLYHSPLGRIFKKGNFESQEPILSFRRIVYKVNHNRIFNLNITTTLNPNKSTPDLASGDSRPDNPSSNTPSHRTDYPSHKPIRGLTEIPL
jgi:hypothetical protein